MDQQTLLDLLGQTCPLSAVFREQLRLSLQFESHKNNHTLLNAGATAGKIYYQLSGNARIFDWDEKGKQKVLRLYQPGQLITEARSFFTAKPSRLSIATMGPCEFLVLTKHSYQKLYGFPEMIRLTESFLLNEKEAESFRSSMLCLSDAEKVTRLFKYYDAHHMKNMDCASFLKMTEQNYCREKGSYNKRR